MVQVSRPEPRTDDLITHWRSISSAVMQAERRIDRLLVTAGVPAQWFAVLRLLLAAEGHRLPMSALAREVSMTSGGFTKLADRMAREGLIDRRGSAADRRVVNATLTDAGLRTAKDADGVFRDAVRQCVLEIISADDLAAAAATLSPLAHAQLGDVADDQAPGMESTKQNSTLPDRRRAGTSNN